MTKMTDELESLAKNHKLRLRKRKQITETDALQHKRAIHQLIISLRDGYLYNLIAIVLLFEFAILYGRIIVTSAYHNSKLSTQ